MSDNNGKLNNNQRQALVKVLTSSYDRKIQRQRELQAETLSHVIREVKDELGVSKIEDELKELDQRMKQLESEKERLGFNKYNDTPVNGSEAQRMISEGTKSEKDLIAKMESNREQKITAIWMATELSEAKELVESALGEIS